MNKTMTSRFLGVVLAVAALGGAGCFSRAHMSKNYGRAYKEAFERQAVNPGAGSTPKTSKGLDAMESSAVVQTYRSQLSPKGGAPASNQQMILVAPPTVPGGSPPAR
jgi:hypothetical protein